MVSIDYSEATVEVLDILRHTKKEDVEKIPKEFITFLKENSSKTYIAKLDYTKKVDEMELRPKTQALLGLIYMKYWADEEGKKKFIEKIKKNEQTYREVLDNDYSLEKIFKKQEKIPEQKHEETMLVETKDNIIQKIIKKIKNIFRRS